MSWRLRRRWCVGRSYMRSSERRLRALEAFSTVRGIEFPPSIVVQPGETVDGVLEREGVSPMVGQPLGYPTLIVWHIVDPVAISSGEVIEHEPDDG